MAYDDKDIKNLNFPDDVRKRPNMYVGDITNPLFGLFQIVKEVMDNSLDETLAGYCDTIQIFINLKTKEILISDNGRGIPQKSINTVMCNLHAGGKFDEKSYSVSAGLHGIGVSAVNALSEFLHCYSIRKNKIVSALFERGIPIQKEKTIKSLPQFRGLKTGNLHKKQGTIICFKPDAKIFGKQKIPIKKIVLWFSLLPKLCPGLKINVTVISGTKKIKKVFYSKKGLKALVHKKDFYFKSDEAECFLKFLPDEPRIEGYVNTIPIHEGTHIQGFWQAYKSAISKYAKKKPPKMESLRESVRGVIHLRLKNPIFVGQTKDKLGGTGIKNKVADIFEKELLSYFKKKPNVAKRIVKQAMAIEKIDATHKKEVKATRDASKKADKGGGLPANRFTKCNQATPIAERELFLLEGESAGGTAKRARDKRFQEVLGMRGKKMGNAVRKATSKSIANEEVRLILLSLGANIKEIIKTLSGKKSKPLKLRTGKIILLPDGDHDGSHIAILTLTVLFQFVQEVFNRGLVYVVDSPLYFAQGRKGGKVYGYTLKEIKEKAPNVTPTRAKGWGEVPWEVLKELAFDKNTRKLLRIEAIKEKDKIQFVKIVGDDTSERKKILGIE